MSVTGPEAVEQSFRDRLANGKPSRRTKVWVGVFCVLLLAVWQARPISFWLTKQWISLRFPDVQSITTTDLAGWIDSKSRRAPLLLDVREEEEYELSHLPEAVRIQPGTSPLEALKGLAPDTPVVTYCSVGYRSAIAARLLRDGGHTNVVNLEGSIFQWANEGRPLEDAQGPASRVHPFSSWVRWLVVPSHRAAIP